MKNFIAKKRDAYRKNEKTGETNNKAAEEGCAFTDMESEGDCPLDNTLDLYEQYREEEEEEKWEKFCATKQSGN